MQNAQRARLKQQQTEMEQEAERAKAKIEDDAKWEVSPSVRAAWGVPADGASGSQAACVPVLLFFHSLFLIG